MDATQAAFEAHWSQPCYNIDLTKKDVFDSSGIYANKLTDAMYSSWCAAIDEPRDKPMSLVVALDFAENPRPKSTMQAPADTMDELREALRVVAEGYRALAAQPGSPTSEFDPATNCEKNHHECEAPEICGSCGHCKGA